MDKRYVFKEFDSIEEGLEKLYDSAGMVKDDSIRSQIITQILQLQTTITSKQEK